MRGRLAELLHLEATAQAEHLSALADAAPQDLLETCLGSRGVGVSAQPWKLQIEFLPA